MDSRTRMPLWRSCTRLWYSGRCIRAWFTLLCLGTLLSTRCVATAKATPTGAPHLDSGTAPRHELDMCTGYADGARYSSGRLNAPAFRAWALLSKFDEVKISSGMSSSRHQQDPLRLTRRRSSAWWEERSTSNWRFQQRNGVTSVPASPLQPALECGNESVRPRVQ